MPNSSFVPRVKLAQAVPTKKVQKRMQLLKDQYEVKYQKFSQTTDEDLKRGHSIGEKQQVAALPIFSNDHKMFPTPSKKVNM